MWWPPCAVGSPLDPRRQWDRLRCEALWVLQSHASIGSRPAVRSPGGADTFEARAAAVRIVADEREFLPQAHERLLVAASQDVHPRVRTEAARGLSFYSDLETARALMAMAEFPEDYWCDYTLQHALGANESVWRSEFLTGHMPEGGERASAIVSDPGRVRTGAAALPFLQTLLSQEPKPAEERQKAMTGLADLRGNVNRGREVFVRTCTACHRVGNGEGREYGPNLAGVAKRLSPVKIVESVIDPECGGRSQIPLDADRDGRWTCW
jgi:mono/diheme cytochrome c family protein